MGKGNRNRNQKASETLALATCKNAKKKKFANLTADRRCLMTQRCLTLPLT